MVQLRVTRRVANLHTAKLHAVTECSRVSVSRFFVDIVRQEISAQKLSTTAQAPSSDTRLSAGSGGIDHAIVTVAGVVVGGVRAL